MTRTLPTTLALLTALTLAGCAGDDGGDGSDGAREPSSESATTDAGSGIPTGTPSASPTPWPAFGPQDYTYRLEVLCFCPQVGRVRIRVEDDEVVAARALDGRLKGKPAPEFVQLTINDIIDRANDPAVDRARVEWPQGQDHPTLVRIDMLERATDDEITYVIRNVRVSAG